MMLLTPPPGTGSLSPIDIPELPLHGLEAVRQCIDEEIESVATTQDDSRDEEYSLNKGDDSEIPDAQSRKVVSRDEKRLTPDEEFRIRISDLLVGAVSSVLAARENLELGEVLEMEGRSIPKHLSESLYILKGTEHPTSDSSPSKTEANWEKLSSYALDLMIWVETTRSGTLIPLHRHKSLKSSMESVDVVKSVITSSRNNSPEEILEYAQERVDKLNHRLDALQSRLEKWAQTEQVISQVCSRKFNRHPTSSFGNLLKAVKTTLKEDGGTRELNLGAETSNGSNSTLASFYSSYYAQTPKIQWLERQATEIDPDRVDVVDGACIRFTEADMNSAIEKLMMVKEEESSSDVGGIHNAEESNTSTVGERARRGAGAQLLHNSLEKIKKICLAQGKIAHGEVVDSVGTVLRSVMQSWEALLKVDCT